MMNDQEQRIQSLELQVLTLKVAVHTLLQLSFKTQLAMTESRYDENILSSETNKMKSDLLLDSEYIREYATSYTPLIDNDILGYLD